MTAWPTAMICAVAAAAITQDVQQPRYVERVDVSRVVVDVRVLDDRYRPIADLEVADFRVTIDSKPAAVESARWIGERPLERDAPDLDARALPIAVEPSAGRLIIFLFQKSMEGHRILGLMQMLIQARGFLDTLTPDDRVAIVSFDSHLKVWVDFTNDHERLAGILKRGILFEHPPAVQASGNPSLVERLAPAQGRRTYHIEQALLRIGEALEPLPGSKSLVLFGHGFGRFRPGPTLETSIVDMENGYEEASKALRASRTSVFSLDVTKADYHTLELGLRQVSEETGGFYTQTHEFPERAMRELAGALAGYYVLLVEKPLDRGRGMRRIKVRLTRRDGTVLARTGYYEP